jgi:6-phosphogluconolactonase
MSISATFLYVGNSETRDISAFRLSDVGELRPIGTFAVPGPTASCYSFPLAVSPDKRLFFVALRNEPWSVRSFAIDAESGRLDYLGFGPLADNTCYISTDRAGRFLLSASYFGSKIAVNPIGPDGIVQPPRQIICTELNSHAILTDAANRYALSTSLGGDIVYQWRFEAETGLLTPNEPPFVSVKRHSGPRHFVFHPNGRFVYVLNEHIVTIHVYSYDADKGTLTEKQVVEAWTPMLADKMSAADIHITPNGKFLYATERKSSTLATFEVDLETGMLSFAGQIITEKHPRGFAVDPTGHFLYCTGQLSNRMSGYVIDRESGELAKLGDYPVGGNPNWVEIVQLP